MARILKILKTVGDRHFTRLHSPWRFRMTRGGLTLALVFLVFASATAEAAVSDDADGDRTKRELRKEALRHAPGLDRDAELMSDDFVLDEGEVYRGDLIVHGNLDILGLLKGDVVAFGDIRLGPEAEIRGDVVAIGGRITRDEGSEVRGDVVEVREQCDSVGARGITTRVCAFESGSHLFPKGKDGGVLFRYKDAAVDEVYLVGDFNDWDEEADPMVRDGDLWKLTVPLEKGRYEYAFIVDGEWTTDPSNPDEVKDREEDLVYSVIHVKRSGKVQKPRKRLTLRVHTHEDHVFDMTARYNRVDAFYLAGSLAFEHRETYVPSARARLGYSWGREEWLGEVEVSQPVIGCDNGLSLGFNYHQDTYSHDFDEEIIGDTENTLAGIFLKEDFRDYYERVGASVFANVKAGSHVNIRVEYWKDDLASLAQNTDWALFGGDKCFRCNPSLHTNMPYCDLRRVSMCSMRMCSMGEVFDPSTPELGTMKSLWGLYTLDLRNDKENPTRGLYARIGGEKAGGDLGGNYTFAKYWADVRKYTKIGPRWYLDLRMLAGAAEDDLPPWKQYYVGGIGTLTARRFKEFRGDRVLLGSLEYRVGLGSDIHGAFFLDSGDAWSPEERNCDIKTDVGIALMDSDNDFRVSYAKKSEDLSGDGVWTLRLNRPF